MTKVLILGGGGMVGQKLAGQLKSDGLSGTSIDDITALDLGFPKNSIAEVKEVVGNLSDKSKLAKLVAQRRLLSVCLQHALPVELNHGLLLTLELLSEATLRLQQTLGRSVTPRTQCENTEACNAGKAWMPTQHARFLHLQLAQLESPRSQRSQRPRGGSSTRTSSTRSASSTCPFVGFTNKPTSIPKPFTARLISLACSSDTDRALSRKKMHPIASAPRSNARSASSCRVMPHILMRTQLDLL